MLDNIKLRKIRFDVIDYLEKVDFVNKIEDFLSQEEKKDLDYARDILREANLDISLKDMEEICVVLKKYIEDLSNVESLDHFAMLDYIQDVNDIASDEDVNEEKLAKAQEKLQSFITQMTQVKYLQVKLLQTVPDIMYVEEKDNCIYDRASNEKIFTPKDYLKGVETEDKEEVAMLAMNFISDMLVRNQRKMITKLDFDEDGYYISAAGEDLFTNEEKDDIMKEVNAILDSLYGRDEMTSDNSDSLGNDIEEIEEPVLEDDNIEEIEDFDIDDDVSVTKKEITKESEDRISRLKTTLKDASNKIKKF